MDLDTTFDELNDLYRQIHGGMVRTGGELLDWARNLDLITDDERDNYYLIAGL